MTDNPDPMGVLEDVWSRLIDAAARAKSAFHTPALATTGADGPRVRTVVLRRAEPEARLLVCHTDRRSAKLAELAADARVGWMFYDREARLQVRADGAARVHVDDELADVQWQAARLSSRRCYLADPGPGAVLDEAGPTLPAALLDRVPSEEEAAEGRRHFAVIACTVEAIDCLMLGFAGHRRLRFRWLDDRWDAQWLAP